MALVGFLLRLGALVAYATWAPQHLEHPYLVGVVLVTVWWLLELSVRGGLARSA